MATPTLEELLVKHEDATAVNRIQDKAIEEGYNLLVTLNKSEKNKWDDSFYYGHTIATAESLTAGLIMSTLVDIPWAGYLKYGSFGVYDTDAKRTYIGVEVDDVYTYRCAMEMAVGILKNSNATIAIAVTGNAMPNPEDVEKLGEVFIGIASYNADGNIIYTTKSINACIGSKDLDFKQMCRSWYSTIIARKGYNPRYLTAAVSKQIRYYTARVALSYCREFITKYKPVVPQFIINRKKRNELMLRNIHSNIPNNKYNEDITLLCLQNCDFSNALERTNNSTRTIKKKAELFLNSELNMMFPPTAMKRSTSLQPKTKTKTMKKSKSLKPKYTRND